MRNLLIERIFQIAYVTNDLTAAIAEYRKRYGIREFMVFDSASGGSKGPPLKIGLVWIGDTMIEFIESVGEPALLYAMDFKPAVLGIRHHHVGHFCETEAQWEALHSELQVQNIPIMREEEVPGVIKFLYADTRDIDGHFREYVLLGEGGQAMFKAIPRHSA
jgi:hypothetical protein